MEIKAKKLKRNKLKIIMNTTILGFPAPTKNCTDHKCPFHGDLNVKRELFSGKVIKKDINRSATIEWFRSHHVPKYERFEIRRVRLRVHNPACLDAHVGDEVLVARTRPLSKTKNHVIIQVTKTGKGTSVRTVSEPARPEKMSAKKAKSFTSKEHPKKKSALKDHEST